MLSENGSTRIPIDEQRGLDNPGTIPPKRIGVRFDSDLGEDDIVRFQDVYAWYCHAMAEASVNTGAGERAPVSFSLDQLTTAARQLGLRLVVLHGSYAKHRAGPQSDLDIAVLGCPADRFWECYESLSEVFPAYSLDLVRLEDADALLRDEIMRDAILLYGDPDLFYEYRAFAYRDFMDSADLFALEDVLFRKKMDRLKEQLDGSP